MLLSKLLRTELIRLPLDAEAPMEAISELVDQLVQAHEIPYIKRDDVLDALRAHEKAFSSGMRDGIAVPHLETDKVDDVLCAMGISEKGIPFNTPDDQPVHIVVLLLAPSRGYALEVETLRDVARTLQEDEVRQQLRAAGTPGGVLDVLRAVERSSG